MTDFVDVDVVCIAFPASEEFNLVAGLSICCSRDCGAFPEGVSGEAGGRDASAEEQIFDFSHEILSTERTECTREQGMGGAVGKSDEERSKGADRANWGGADMEAFDDGRIDLVIRGGKRFYGEGEKSLRLPLTAPPPNR